MATSGTGYLIAPVVTLTGGTFTTAATATANLGTGATAGMVVSITVSGGTGYTVVPTVTIAPPTPLTESYNATTGVLTLSGVAPLATYQALLQSVTYNDTSTNPSPSQRIVTFTVNDGSLINNISSPIGATKQINVTPITVAPTINQIANPPTIVENSTTTTVVQLSGITAGGGQIQNLTVTATVSNSSENPALISTPILVNYTSPNTTGTLSFTVNPNEVGTAVILVTVTSDGGTANGGQDMTTVSFLVTVGGINQPPTLNPIANPNPILENTNAPQVIALSNITPGVGNPAGELVTVSASSSNTALIPNPAVTYTNFNNLGVANTTGSLSYIPVPNASGTATITVTVMNNGGTANGGINTFSQTFTVTVTPVNQQPTLAAIANPPSIPEFPVQTPPVTVLPQPESILLTGLTAGPGDTGQSLTITATSSNTSVIAPPTVYYTSPASTGAVAYTPVPGASGSATITVTVTDNGGTANGGINTISQSFVATVTPVNQIPTLNPITNPTPILEGTTTNPATLQTLNLSGITDGIGDVGQLLTVTAVSSNTGLIPNPTVTYTSPDSNGYLSYTPVAFASGTANITVTVMDNGGTANGGVNQVSRIFTVRVTPIDQAPTLNPIPNPVAILEGANSGTVTLTGITAGSGDTGQILTISASSSTSAATAGTAVLSGGGITTIPIINGGSGYPSAPAVTINGGGSGSGFVNATATAVLTNGVVTAIQITNTGSGYTSEPSVVIAPPPGLLINSFTINYTSPATTGTLSFQPANNSYGTATVTVTVMDNGSTANGGVNTFSQTFTATVLPVNHAPTLGQLSPITIAENTTAPTTVLLSGISDGDNGTQVVTISASSSVPTLIANPGSTVPGAIAINYSNPSSAGSLTFTPIANQSGTAVITVIATDNGGTANGGVNTSIPQTFTVTVTPVNLAPTFTIGTPAPVTTFQESTTTQPVTVNLTAIKDGTSDPTGQTLTVTATSSNTVLVSAPTVVYTSPNATGTLSYNINPFLSGSATITVTVMDSGSTAGGGVVASSQSYTITVNPVNQPPTLDPIQSPMGIVENQPTPVTVNLTGISAGRGDNSQAVEVFVSGSTNSNLLSGLSVNYTPGSTTGTITFTPAPNQSGSDTIGVVVEDSSGATNNKVTQSFTVNVASVNQAPTINPISLSSYQIAAPSKTVSLTGIHDGAGDPAGQPVTINATSSNPAVVDLITASAIDKSGTAQLLISSPGTANPGDSSTITVSVSDGASSGASTSVVRTFTVWYVPTNAGPTVTPSTSGNPTFVQGASPVTIDRGLTITDQVTINSATVQIDPQSYVQGEDFLSYTDPTGGLVTAGAGFNAATGTLTLTGNNVTPAVFSTALQAVTYSFSPPATGFPATTPPRQVVFTVTDSGPDNNVGTAVETINVSPVNHAPTLLVESVPAAATATLNGNAVGAITVNYGGSNYVYPPAVTITGGGGSGATATAVLGTGASAGTVTGIDFTGGAGYTSIPTVTIAPPYAIATATATIASGAVNGIVVNSGGAGYLSPPVVTLTGGGFTTPATATAVLTNGVVTGINFTGGTGYTSAPAVLIAPPTTAAVASATLTGGAVSAITTNGSITAINVTAQGSGYSSASPPAVTIAPPVTGTPATATAIVNASGVVTGITITNAGSGYTSANPPAITIASPSGGGATATATATFTSAGAGYLSPPVVTITGGGGSGATATAVLTNGMVTSVQINTAGSGYTSAPTVTIARQLIDCEPPRRRFQRRHGGRRSRSDKRRRRLFEPRR